MERYSLDDLRLFLAVARRRSFVTAATQLGMPTSTLSRRIARLETATGCRLFHRTSRRVALSHEGEQLVSRAGGLLDELSAIGDDILDAGPRLRGTVRVTAPVVTGAEWVAPVAMALAQRYPELRVQLRLTNQLVDLVDGQVDIAVRLGPLRQRGLIARKLRTAAYAFVAAPAFVERELAGKTRITLEQLANLRAVAPSETVHWRLRTGARTVTMRPKTRFVADDPRVILEAAAAGLGTAYAPEELVARFGARLVPLTVVDHTPESRSMYIVYPARNVAPRVRVMIDWLLDHARARG